MIVVVALGRRLVGLYCLRAPSRLCAVMMSNHFPESVEEFEDDESLCWRPVSGTAKGIVRSERVEEGVFAAPAYVVSFAHIASAVRWAHWRWCNTQRKGFAFMGPCAVALSDHRAPTVTPA